MAKISQANFLTKLEKSQQIANMLLIFWRAMDSESRKLFGQRIKDRRLQLGLSQLELAQKIHKSSAAYIAFIESGERNISTMDIMLLVKTLKTTVSDLLGESDSKTSVLIALRADSTLSESDKQALMSIYRTVKEKHEDR